MNDSVDVSIYIAIAVRENQFYLRGAHTLLMLDHGTYPYVSSSNTTNYVGPLYLDYVLGITKFIQQKVGLWTFSN